MGQLMGADFTGVRVHTDAESDRMCRSVQATAFTTGQDLFFRQRAYAPGTPAGQELIAHELTHVVQQGDSQVRRNRSPGEIGISSTASGRLQRRFGFEIELPMLLTEQADTAVPDPGGGPPHNFAAVPRDPGVGDHETQLVNFPGCYINVDHSRTLDKLFTADLDQYAIDQGLGAPATAILKAPSTISQLMPSGMASIVEVVTQPWDETSLDRDQARTRIQSVIGTVKGIYDHIDGGHEYITGGFRFGSNAPNSSVFQPRLGYFHATYGVKLSQIPRLFEQTTKQKQSMKRYAKKNVGERGHARNVELTSRSVPAAKSAMKQIKRLWPTIVTHRRWLPDTTKVDMSSAAEKDFLGFLTLLANYILLLKSNTGGDDLLKKQVGMHYYKSDLHEVFNQLPDEVKGRLQAADSVVLEGVIDAICNAVGINNSDTLNDAFGDVSVKRYLEQIFTGRYGALAASSGEMLTDPVLAISINPWSTKLGPEQLGPAGNQGLGAVLENRHLEYLDPRYGRLVSQDEATTTEESVRYGPPKAGVDLRSAETQALYDSIGARSEGPAKRPIGEWETMMMNTYEMIKRINSRQ